jgi:hypothetical protein
MLEMAEAAVDEGATGAVVELALSGGCEWTGIKLARVITALASGGGSSSSSRFASSALFLCR